MPPPALQSFVDDELMRAPLLIELTLRATLDGLRRRSRAFAAAERTMTAELLIPSRDQRHRSRSAGFGAKWPAAALRPGALHTAPPSPLQEGAPA
jgi:hypothetical protein